MAIVGGVTSRGSNLKEKKCAPNKKVKIKEGRGQWKRKGPPRNSVGNGRKRRKNGKTLFLKGAWVWIKREETPGRLKGRTRVLFSKCQEVENKWCKGKNVQKRRRAKKATGGWGLDPSVVGAGQAGKVRKKAGGNPRGQCGAGTTTTHMGERGKEK